MLKTVFEMCLYSGINQINKCHHYHENKFVFGLYKMKIFCDKRLFFLLLKTKRANASPCHLGGAFRAARVARTQGCGGAWAWSSAGQFPVRRVAGRPLGSGEDLPPLSCALQVVKQ